MPTFAMIPLLGPTPMPTPTPNCVRSSDLCQVVFRYTKIPWLAESSYWVLVKPLRIALIIVLALVARWLVHRMINRLVRHTAEVVAAPGLLRPLRDRMPVALRNAAAAPSERRRQRAETLGSVLRSVASAMVFSVAAMLVLAELSVNLGPILASAGIAGIAIGFGAQNLVKDFLAGLFILLEDQYGVGDVIDTGTVNGVVAAVGLRITTLRDDQGAVWYIRNGEILRVGNKSQGWALVHVDVPVTFETVRSTTELLRSKATELAEDPDWADDLVDAPEVVGVEQITNDGVVLRTTVKTTSDAQWRVGRELRRRFTAALHDPEAAADAAADADADAAATADADNEWPDGANQREDAPRPGSRGQPR